MVDSKSPIRVSHSKRFFLRGLTVLLPSVLTIWILITAYQFVQLRIAEPINRGIRVAMVQWSPWPKVLESELQSARKNLGSLDHEQMRQSVHPKDWLRRYVKTRKVARLWSAYRFPLDLMGLMVAVVLIYMVGMLFGSYIGHQLYRRGERLLQRLPLIKQVYPSVKQITDFLVANPENRKQFSRVVAVQYPRRGVWAIGFVTGGMMKSIGAKVGQPCVTVFIPSSPTPFTGYTVTIPKQELVDLPISVEDALRFTVSGGVVLPSSEQEKIPAVSGQSDSPALSDDHDSARTLSESSSSRFPSPPTS